MKKQTKKGFTLVELVIVIAVIAILSAILIPTFGNVIADAKEKAELEDARTAYQEFLVDHSDDTAVTTANVTAYILIGATKGEGDNATKINTAKAVYTVTNGSVKKEDSTDGTLDTKLKVTFDETVTANTDAALGTAYKLSKAGMYIVFLAASSSTTNP